MNSQFVGCASVESMDEVGDTIAVVDVEFFIWAISCRMRDSFDNGGGVSGILIELNTKGKSASMRSFPISLPQSVPLLSTMAYRDILLYLLCDMGRQLHYEGRLLHVISIILHYHREEGVHPPSRHQVLF